MTTAHPPHHAAPGGRCREGRPAPGRARIRSQDHRRRGQSVALARLLHRSPLRGRQEEPTPLSLGRMEKVRWWEAHQESAEACRLEALMGLHVHPAGADREGPKARLVAALQDAPRPLTADEIWKMTEVPRSLLHAKVAVIRFCCAHCKNYLKIGVVRPERLEEQKIHEADAGPVEESREVANKSERCWQELWIPAQNQEPNHERSPAVSVALSPRSVTMFSKVLLGRIKAYVLSSNVEAVLVLAI